MAILDMTDVDSVESMHRKRVEEVLPMVDVGVWVLDPVKYADATLHEFTPLASRQPWCSSSIRWTRSPDERGIAGHLVAAPGRWVHPAGVPRWPPTRRSFGSVSMPAFSHRASMKRRCTSAASSKGPGRKVAAVTGVEAVARLREPLG
jgi:hypothetical protein